VRRRGAEAVHILEVGPNGVEWRLETAGARGEHAFAARGQQFSLVARPRHRDVEREITGAEGDALDAGAGGCDGAEVGETLGGLDNRNDVDGADRQSAFTF
jgi:hypothetical protein